MSCKAKNCYMYKTCLAKYDCADFCCADYRVKDDKPKSEKQRILEMKSIAYYSGLNGLEIKTIEYGIDNYVLCVSGAWNGKPQPHKVRLDCDSKSNYYFKVHGYKIPLSECIRMGV